jgi:serine phosphatase RsbU (regulator of sigma subunit)
MRQLTISKYLLMRIAPVVILPLGLIYWYFAFEFTEPYIVGDRARNLSYSRAISDRIDQEILIQSNFFKALSSRIPDIPTSGDWNKLPDFLKLIEEQDYFKIIYLVNAQGHIFWASEERAKDLPQLRLDNKEAPIEIRYLEDATFPSFIHTFPLRYNESEFRLVGVFDLSFLSPLCTVFNQSSPGHVLVVFPNHARFKYFECRVEKQSELILDKIDPQNKKALIDIKNKINDVRFRENVMHELGIVGATQAPLKVGFIKTDALDSRRDFGPTGMLVLCAILALGGLAVSVTLSTGTISSDLMLFEKSLVKLGDNPTDYPVKSNLIEIERHLNSITSIFKYQEEQKIRNRILQKAFLELFSTKNIDAILEKSAEIIGIHTEAKLVLFVPDKIGQFQEFGQMKIFVGVHAWIRRDGRTSAIELEAVPTVLEDSKKDRMYEFKISKSDKILGIFSIFFDKTPSDFKLSILHGIVFLIESTIVKYETLKREASILMEMELASMVQRSIFENDSGKGINADVSYYFQPSSRLGGDWLYLFESTDKKTLTFLIGDVSGAGLNQGLVSTAAKGAMDMIVSFMQEGSVDSLSFTPSKIISHLDAVLKRVLSKGELTMTCLCGQISYPEMKLRICNAGHTFPIILRSSDSQVGRIDNNLVYLSKNQNALLGQNNSEKLNDTSYDLNKDDFIFVYTDGLSDVKHMKSSVFRRILHRKLKSIDLTISPNVIRDEISNLFQYYTQGKIVDDDVCFIFIKIPSQKERSINLLAV